MTRDEPNTSEKLRGLFEAARSSDEYQIESVILGFTEKIHERLQVTGITRSELARRLGKSRAYVTKILRGNANMTLRTQVLLARALGCTLEVDLHDHSESKISQFMSMQYSWMISDTESLSEAHQKEVSSVRLKRSINGWLRNARLPARPGINRIERVSLTKTLAGAREVLPQQEEKAEYSSTAFWETWHPIAEEDR